MPWLPESEAFLLAAFAASDPKAERSLGGLETHLRMVVEGALERHASSGEGGRRESLARAARDLGARRSPASWARAFLGGAFTDEVRLRRERELSWLLEIGWPG